MSKQVGEISERVEYVTEWTIKDFSSLPVENVVFLESPIIHFSDAIWYLSIYPNGRKLDQKEGCMNLYLHRKSPGPPITMEYSLGMKTVDGKLDFEKHFTHAFNEVKDYNCCELPSRTKLLERNSDLLPKDTLTLVCRIKYTTLTGFQRSLDRGYLKEKESVESDQSSSKQEEMPCVAKVDLMHEKLKKLVNGCFDEESPDENYLIKGEPLGIEDISGIMKELGKNIDISAVDKDYIEFLNQYGSLKCNDLQFVGKWFHEDDKIQSMLSSQRGFQYRLKMFEFPKIQIKSCWLLVDEIYDCETENMYYFNFSAKKEGYIYVLNRGGTSTVFANNFLEFLDRLFELRKMKAEIFKIEAEIETSDEESEIHIDSDIQTQIDIDSDDQID